MAQKRISRQNPKRVFCSIRITDARYTDVRIPYFVVNAFTNRAFAGNPAGVCILDDQLPGDVMQDIARWNRLSETAFVRPLGADYEIRWFTPEVEMDLCGHATLASGWVLGHLKRITRGEKVTLQTMSAGPLTLRLENQGSVSMDFPSRPPSASNLDAAHVEAALGEKPLQICSARDTIVVYRDQSTIEGLQPDFDRVKMLDTFGVVVTAPGDEVDFVSRFFAPRAGINEDPVTGSTHCTLTPFWANELGKRTLTAKQLSAEGGDLTLRLAGDRVQIGGECFLYSVSEIRI